MKILPKFLSIFKTTDSHIQTEITKYEKISQQINLFHQALTKLPDSRLLQLSKRLKQNDKLLSQSYLIEAFAIAKETVIRQLGITPFDVQLIAGLGLYEGKLIEMKTGEGKTLAAIFAAYAQALEGNRVHILTFNRYLAKRDANWMRPIYEALGLTVSHVDEQDSIEEKKLAYSADVTYTTAKQLGFDYLRSFITYDSNDIILPPLRAVIVDEADAILIDEARNPLVLAGNITDSGLDFKKIALFTSSLRAADDYEINQDVRNVFLTDTGITKAEIAFKTSNLQTPDNLDLLSAINLSLHARIFIREGVDYLVKDGKVKLIDEFTGRIVHDRKWRHGLQTAVLAIEGLPIVKEGAILNTITFQQMLSKYPRVAGMTATAKQSAEEFADFYKLETLIIPPNKAVTRIDYPDQIYKTKAMKYSALVKEIRQRYVSGQPVLVGTLTVRESQELAEMLKNQDVQCQILNAKNDEEEAAIIAEAGNVGAVTISTNMAGRGTDIMLSPGYKEGREKILALNGLCVIGTNRHESSRIDDQLRGRAGRQGDIGETRFFTSLEDDLMVKYKLDKRLPKRFRDLDFRDQFHDMSLGRYVDDTQRTIENCLFDVRKSLLEFSTLIEMQRVIFQEERQHILSDLIYFKEKYLEKGTISNIADHVTIKKAQVATLLLCDKYWSQHLDHASQIREGIHLLRLGGQHPLRQFRKRVDVAFNDMITLWQNEVANIIQRLAVDPEVDLEEFGMKKPTTTWTFIINENPFDDQLSVMLLDNSNIGLQTDFISVFFLFFRAMWKRLFSKK